MAEVRPDQLLAAAPAGATTTRWPIRQWADKPYGFANFLRAARFVNSLYNGRRDLQADQQRRRLRLGHLRRSDCRRGPSAGMYDLAPRAGRDPSPATGLRPAEPGRVDQGGLLRPRAAAAPTPTGSTRPTPGVFGDGDATAPNPTDARPVDRRCHQRGDPAAGHVPRRADSRHRPGARASCSPSNCSTVNPFGLDPTTYAEVYQGSLEHGRPGEDALAVGHARPGRQRGRVDRHDHAAPAGNGAAASGAGCTAASPTHRPSRCGRPRSASSRRTTPVLRLTYPWLGIRIGVIGDLKPGKS